MALIVYYTTVTPNTKVKKNQERVKTILETKKIDYIMVDVTEIENEEKKASMQAKVMKAKCLKINPIMPQLFRGDEYIGDYDDFDEAVEKDQLNEFLKVGDAQ